MRPGRSPGAAPCWSRACRWTSIAEGTPGPQVFELVEEHAGHRLERRRPGFEFSPGLLGRIATFLVRLAPGGHAVYAFMAPLLAREAVDDEVLLWQAVELVKARLDFGQARPGDERTFERRDGRWVEVSEPRWWVKV